MQYNNMNTNNANNTQEVTAMEVRTEEYALQLTNAVNGITATLLFDGDKMTEANLDEVMASFEYVLFGDEDFAPITIARVKHPKQFLCITESFEYPITISDNTTGRNVDIYLADIRTSEVIVATLNAVFTGTSFIAGMGTNRDFTRHTLEEERHREACEKALEEVKQLREEREKTTRVLTLDDFMKECTSCGGDWTAMLLSGIENVDPELYAALPDEDYDYGHAVFVVNHMCSDRPHLRYGYGIFNDERVLVRNDDGTYYFRDITEEEKNTPKSERNHKFNGTEE